MRRFIVLLFLAPLLVLAACAPSRTSVGQTDPQPFETEQDKPAVSTEPASPAANHEGASADLTRTDQQGAVVATVTPLNLDNSSDQLEFQIALETHSVDLSMDLATLATLTTDTGFSVAAALWDAPRGGHHVAGKLIFPATKDGKSILDGARELTLTIIDVDVPSRVFKWELK